MRLKLFLLFFVTVSGMFSQNTNTLPASTVLFNVNTNNSVKRVDLIKLPYAVGKILSVDEQIILESQSKTAKPSVLEKHRIWLNMSNTGGAFKQLLIGYIEGATNGYDRSFDGISFDANAYIDFYSINLGSNLVIQARALPFTDADEVALGYRTIISGEFTISIDQADGKLLNQPVYLEDKLTNTFHDLRQNGYTFTTGIGVFNNRFVIRYTNKTLTNDDFEAVDDAVSIGIKNQIISINSAVENIDKIFVYDIFGRQLSNNENIKDKQLVIQDLSSTQQILLVKVFLENGKAITKKVLFK